MQIDPAILPVPPLEFRRAVAGADVTPAQHQQIGRIAFEAVRKFTGLKPTESVLDIGSGCGRVAQPLAQYLTTGRYQGFDIVRPMVDWCQQNISARHPNFKFQHISLKNTLYSGSGSDASTFIFPYLDNSFDVAFATSVFTHLVPKSAAQYAEQVARVLKADGRAFLTFYIVSEEYFARLARKEKFDCSFTHRRDRHALTDPANPESVIAYEPDYARELLGAAGLKIDGFSVGSWNRNPDAWFYQDSFLLSRRK